MIDVPTNLGNISLVTGIDTSMQLLIQLKLLQHGMQLLRNYLRMMQINVGMGMTQKKKAMDFLSWKIEMISVSFLTLHHADEIVEKVLAGEENCIVSMAKVSDKKSDSNDEVGTADSLGEVEYNIQYAPDGWKPPGPPEGWKHIKSRRTRISCNWQPQELEEIHKQSKIPKIDLHQSFNAGRWNSSQTWCCNQKMDVRQVWILLQLMAASLSNFNQHKRRCNNGQFFPKNMDANLMYPCWRKWD